MALHGVFLHSAERPPAVHAASVIPAAQELTAQIRQVKGSRSVTSAKRCSNNGK
jgi:hypothetical protein